MRWWRDWWTAVYDHELVTAANWPAKKERLQSVSATFTSFAGATIERRIQRKAVMDQRKKRPKELRGPLPPPVPFPSDQLVNQIHGSINVIIETIDRILSTHKDAKKLEVRHCLW